MLVLALPVIGGALFLLALGVVDGADTATGAVSALGDLLRAAVEHTAP